MDFNFLPHTVQFRFVYEQSFPHYFHHELCDDLRNIFMKISFFAHTLLLSSTFLIQKRFHLNKSSVNNFAYFNGKIDNWKIT